MAFVAAVESALSPDGRQIGERARERVTVDYNWSETLKAVDQHLRRSRRPQSFTLARAEQATAQ
jgi:hypothetical protein